MKAKDINRSHIGWVVKVDYINGILQFVEEQNGKVYILARTVNGIEGIRLDPQRDIDIEKRLEDQVREEIKEGINTLTTKALRFMRNRVR